MKKIIVIALSLVTLTSGSLILNSCTHKYGSWNCPVSIETEWRMGVSSDDLEYLYLDVYITNNSDKTIKSLTYAYDGVVNYSEDSSTISSSVTTGNSYLGSNLLSDNKLIKSGETFKLILRFGLSRDTIFNATCDFYINWVKFTWLSGQWGYESLQSESAFEQHAFKISVPTFIA